MNEKEIESFFTGILQKERNVSAGMAAIRTLLRVLENDKSETVRELDLNFQTAISVIKDTEVPATAIDSGCQLFMRFITFATLDSKDFKNCKNIMIERGKIFLSNLEKSRTKVAKLSSSFIVDGCKILTHSKSRVVLEAMQHAVKGNKRFEVFVTTSAIDKTGEEMYKCLKELNIPCTQILDSAVGYIMEQVDMVMVGAEGVVESGGIINKIGSFTVAMCAKEMCKPFYVLTESFKFVRLYPLNQRDLPNEFKFTGKFKGKDTSKEHPLVDYTPPSYITLLFTDLGILTPSAVSDELIKLYL